MSNTEFGIVCVFVFALLYIGWHLYNDAYPPTKTVEQEEDESRAVLAHIGQHHPSTPGISSNDYDDELGDYTDPIWHAVNIARQNVK